MAQPFQKPEPRMVIKKDGFGSKLLTLSREPDNVEYNRLRALEHRGLLGFTLKQFIENKSGPVQLFCEWVEYEIVDDDKLDEIENNFVPNDPPAYDAHDLEILASESSTDAGDD